MPSFIKENVRYSTSSFLVLTASRMQELGFICVLAGQIHVDEFDACVFMNGSARMAHYFSVRYINMAKHNK